LNKKSI